MGSNRATSNGPDVTDVATLAAAIQSLHGVRVTLMMSPDGSYGEGGLLLLALAEKNDVPIGARQRSVSRRHRFPNVDSRTLEGALYKLLHELDNDCGAFWQQERLPGA